ncbi:MAG: hypothetical protein Q8L47_02670 [bacterium]|nr:hypothetical protein [bacterium]
MQKVFNMLRQNRGSSLIEVLIGVMLLVMFAFSLYTSLVYVLNILSRTAGISAIHSILTERVEFIKNLNYADIGIVSGVPSGILPSEETYVRDDRTIKLTFFVRNIDDPFDGTIGGTPNDTAPSDYKLVELHGICTTCPVGTQEELTVRIAPKGLENSTGNGALFINVFNASGVALKDAEVTIINSSTTPPISISDITDLDGYLRIVDTPTSTEGYKISVTKAGYSTDITYSPDNPDNPNPLKPYATVASGQITSISFAIDALSTFAFTTTDYLCKPIANVNYDLDGTKLIGTVPDIKKYATSSKTSATGLASHLLEWDDYTLDWTDANYIISGLTPFGSSTFTLSPNSSISRKYIVGSSTPKSLLVTVIESATSALINETSITLTKDGLVYVATSGITEVSDTDWSSNNYTDKNGIDTNTNPGSFTMESSGGIYPTSTTSWLTSRTFDFGSTTIPKFFSFNPVSQPNQTTLQFQIASNNDNSTWNYLGPNGTNGTYYAQDSIISSDHESKRYLRYQAYLSTLDELQTPIVTGLTISFSGGCVPGHQALFSGLTSGPYDLLVEKSGYSIFSSTVNVSNNTQEVVTVLTPN